MHHIPVLLSGLAITLLTATSAHASAIYHWHSTSPGRYVTAVDGELAFTDAAYRSGSLDWDNFDAIYDPDTGRITNSPVLWASLSMDGGPGVFVDPSSQSFSEYQLPFTSAVTFNSDGTLSGYLFLYDSRDASQEVEARGTREDWTVFNYGSDYFAGEQCGPPTCFGGLGYWQLSSGPVQVPEPPIWPLFGLGALGLFSLLTLRGQKEAKRCQAKRCQGQLCTTNGTDSGALELSLTPRFL